MMRRSLVARSLSIGALACALAAGAWAAPVSAQTVSGRVVERETGAALTASLVELLDSAGAVQTAVLSDSTGAFVLRAAAPGRYHVRAEHIGRETVASEELQLGAGAATSVRLAAPIAAVLMRPLVIEGRARCQLRPDAGEATARLWEEARKALRVAQVARRSGTFAVRRFDRVRNPTNDFILQEVEHEVVAVGAKPMLSTSEADLNRLGYARIEQDRWVYWGPDEEVLLSDGFLDHHCIRLRGGDRQHKGLVALEFKPLRGDARDIEGTFWLEAATAVLKSVEFSFSGLPWDLPRNARSGSVEFTRLPTGALVIGYWSLRTPVMAADRISRLAPATLVRVMETGAQLMDENGKPVGDGR